MQVDYVGHDVNPNYVLHNETNILPFNIAFSNYVCRTYHITLCCIDQFVSEAKIKVEVGNTLRIW